MIGGRSLFAIHTGMRLGEMLNLPWKNVFIERKEILVQNTKSGNDRIIPLNEVALGILQERDRCNSGNGLVFGCKNIYSAWYGALRRSGITDFRFHDLRHTCGTRLDEKGSNPNVVKEILGHTTIRTTERYVHPSRNLKKQAVDTLVKKETAESESAKKRNNPCRICDAKEADNVIDSWNDLFSIT